MNNSQQNNQNFKKIGLRLLYLMVLALVSIFVYNRFVWPKDRSEHAYFLDQLAKDNNTSDIIYIGESSNFWFHKDSGDNREISKMLEHKTKRKVLNLSQSAYHLGIYRPMFSHFREITNLKDVVLTINLRTFGPPCVHSNLETSLQKDKLFLEDELPFLKKMKAVFSLYDNTDAKIRDEAMWQQWTYDTLMLANQHLPFHTVKEWCGVTKFPDSSGNEDMSKRVLADDYVKAYGFNLSVKNPRVQDLDAIVLQARNANYRLHLLILSENTAWGDSLAGKDLGNLIRSNRDFILNRYQNKPNIYVIDNLETVPPKYFGEKNWTTEHYFWQGRAMIADSIQRFLKQF